jgi:hypothetical protein
MGGKISAKVTHHCWCGTAGKCRKLTPICEKHTTKYYSSGKCKSCEGEEAAAARKERKEKQEGKRQDDEMEKRNQDEL